jgi:hypothetical protein
MSEDTEKPEQATFQRSEEAELRMIHAEERAELTLKRAEERLARALERLQRAEKRVDRRKDQLERARAELRERQLERATGPTSEKRETTQKSGSAVPTKDSSPLPVAKTDPAPEDAGSLDPA